jgi:hypothetical protein
VVDSAGSFASTSDNPVTVSGSSGSTVTLSTPASESQASDNLMIEWTTSGLPEDIAFPNLRGAEGNGQKRLGEQRPTQSAGRKKPAGSVPD